MSKPVILTGLRANNDLHLGNYLGALLPMVDMANKQAGEHQINLFVPDLHSFTTPIDHSKLYQQSIDNVKVFVATGLHIGHENVHIYRQSFIPAHSELAIILNSFVGVGEMERMTQYKEKIASSVEKEREFAKHLEELFRKNINENNEVNDAVERMTQYKKRIKINEKKYLSQQKYMQSLSDIVLETEKGDIFNIEVKSKKDIGPSVGLFDYPVLMAADILLYGASYVPVGDDQTQHLEFTRNIAERMNKKFGELFVVPNPVAEQHKFFGKDQGLRIRDLLDPNKKMSKSDDTGKGVIFLSDKPEEAAKKVMSATTDSLNKIALDFEKQPGVSNLLQIHALLSGETLDAVTKHHGGETNYSDLKKEVAEQVKEFLNDFQAKLSAVNEHEVIKKLEASEAEMNRQANETLAKVQKAVGLRK